MNDLQSDNMSTGALQNETVSYAMFRPRLAVPGLQANNGTDMQLYKPIQFESAKEKTATPAKNTKSDIQNTLTNSGSKSIDDQKEEKTAVAEPAKLAPLLTDAAVPAVFAKNNVSSTTVQIEQKTDDNLPKNNNVAAVPTTKWKPSKTVKTILYGLLAFIIAFIVIFVLFYTLNPVFVQQKPPSGLSNKDSAISIDQPPSLTKVSLYALAAGLIAASLPHIYARFIAKKK